jgi:hypothetical protein
VRGPAAHLRAVDASALSHAYERTIELLCERSARHAGERRAEGETTVDETIGGMDASGRRDARDASWRTRMFG